MSNKVTKSLSLAVGAALIGSFSVANASTAFNLVDLGTGYMLAAAGEGKCGEGKCGEGKCGEGKCGMEKMDSNKDGSVSKAESQAHHDAMFAGIDTNKDGSVSKAEFDAHHAAKRGHDKGKEGSCGGDKGKEGSCGGDKGKEGSCGGSR